MEIELVLRTAESFEQADRLDLADLAHMSPVDKLRAAVRMACGNPDGDDAGAPPPDARVAVRATIAALSELLAGRLPPDVDPQTLFEVDLLDPTASTQRIARLRASIAETEHAIRATPTTRDVADGGAEAGVASLDGAVAQDAASALCQFE